MYLSLMLKSEGFRGHSPESFTSDGRKVDGTGIQEQQLIDKGGSIKDLESFIVKAKECAVVVPSVSEVKKQLKGGRSRLK